ncbi:hypothetical protein TIFTF001_025805 [Ficus carica]|uniref:Uncharacterized protein n=1 Tax=Ficus carica TaxID=3494 RepID=A0AA88AQF8_FICCA|nr:hypothetical protein TIFTF001_025805 [Ficus carica]
MAADRKIFRRRSERSWTRFCSSRHEERGSITCRQNGRRISPESHLEVYGGETLNGDFRRTVARKTTKRRLPDQKTQEGRKGRKGREGDAVVLPAVHLAGREGGAAVPMVRGRAL